MLKRSFVIGFSLLGVIGAAAWAGTIKDPQMGIEDASFSPPIATGAMFVPVNGGGTFDFQNDTGHTIISLTFLTTIGINLSPTQISDNFSCNQPATGPTSDPFFLGCFIDYSPRSGNLTIMFSGVNPNEPGVEGCDTEVGEHEGIPTTVPDCPGVGHFLVTLNDNFAPTGAQGGWGVDPTLFPNGTPTFTVANIGFDVPEPATWLLLTPALMGIGILSRRRRR